MSYAAPARGLIGTVAYFPERYGDELITLALGMLQKKSVPAHCLRQAPAHHAAQRRPALSAG